MALLTQTASDYYGGSDLGNYQFITVKDVINNFMVAYVGEGKIINKVKRTDVLFHASRAVQEFNFDILPSTKAIEIDLGPALTFQLPQDYVNYVNVSYTDSEGIQRIIYPTRDTSAPTAPMQNADFDILFDNAGAISAASPSTTLTRFKSNTFTPQNDEIQNLSDSDILNLYRYGERYGISPENAHSHGVFYIDNTAGVLRFSSNLKDKPLTLKYVSDGVATADEMKVHKFAEEAMYKHLMHAILSTRANIPEYQVNRYKKEMTAAKRNAKLRLSNIKIAELAQVMRNQAKWIKH